MKILKIQEIYLNRGKTTLRIRPPLPTERVPLKIPFWCHVWIFFEHFGMAHVSPVNTECTTTLDLSRGSNKHTLVARVFAQWLFCRTHQYFKIRHQIGAKLRGVRFGWIFLKTEVWEFYEFSPALVSMEVKYAVKFSRKLFVKFSRKWRKRYNGRLCKI